MCQGCGTCAAECPAQAIQLMHYRDAEMLPKIDALFDRVSQPATGVSSSRIVDHWWRSNVKSHRTVALSDNGFEPNIIAFCCHYCAYAAADLAGSMRLEYPTAVKIVELPCTGKLDVLYVLRAFEDGADGVLVAG